MVELARRLTRSMRDERGNVAMIFAAVLVPVIGIVSAAVDYGLASRVRSTLQAAASAAAQAGSAHLGEDRRIIEAKVAGMLKVNLPPDLARLPYTVKIANDLTSVEVVMEATVPTMLMGVMGVSELNVEASGYARPAVAALAGGTNGPATETVAAEPGQAVRRIIQSINRGQSTFGEESPAGLPAITSQDELRAAAAEIAQTLQAIRGQAGGGQLQVPPVALPPEASAEIERMMRDLRRSMR